MVRDLHQIVYHVEPLTVCIVEVKQEILRLVHLMNQKWLPIILLPRLMSRSVIVIGAACIAIQVWLVTYVLIKVKVKLIHYSIRVHSHQLIESGEVSSTEVCSLHIDLFLIVFLFQELKTLYVVVLHILTQQVMLLSPEDSQLRLVLEVISLIHCVLV